MIYYIIRKEILENFLSLRFILSLLLIILLFATSGFVMTGRYKQALQEYWHRTNENLSILSEYSRQLYKLAFCEQNIYSKPKPLSICATGFEESLPNHFKFTVFRTYYPSIKNRSNFMISHFSDIDWVFIISLLLSFVALLLTYDSICGEREAGTLRLILAGPIPRHIILLAKYFSAMFTMGIPLLIGILINLVIVVNFCNTNFGFEEWFRIIVITILSFLYLSIFVLLGMLVSTRAVYSPNSMVILLIIWIGLTILIPSCGRVLATTLHSIPTHAEWSEKRRETLEQITRNAESDKYGRNAFQDDSDPKSPRINPPARARFINARYEAHNKIIEEHHNQMLSQALTGQKLTGISPTIVFRRVVEAISGTGINRVAALYNQNKEYQANLKEYIRREDSQDPHSLHLLFPAEYSVVAWKTISPEPADFETVPKFQERQPNLSGSLKLVIWDIGLLALFNIVFFAGAHVSFLRYDVR